MIEFLKESKLCIVNGRICPLSDDYTSVSIKGKALVYYILVPYDCLQICNSFEVLVSNQLIKMANCMDLIGERSRVPDHSLLWLHFFFYKD